MIFVVYLQRRRYILNYAKFQTKIRIQAGGGSAEGD